MRRKKDNGVVDICGLLFEQRPKPKHFYDCKAINVYSNKYRINVWSKWWDEEVQLDKQRMTYSCFAALENNELKIRYESPASGCSI